MPGCRKAVCGTGGGAGNNKIKSTSNGKTGSMKTKLKANEDFHSRCVPKNEEVEAENVKNFTKPVKSSCKQVKYLGGEKREVMKLVNHDMIREIIIPQDTHMRAMVFDAEKFTKLKQKSRYITPKEKMEMVNRAKEKKKMDASESAMRKKDLKSYDNIREHGTRLTELEEEADRRANHLLARAFELRQEQEDEIKKCNALILGAKCHAIRDAQIAEKALLNKELDEEDERLEMLMEEERLRAIREQERKKELELLKKKRFTQTILEQIKENELQREMTAENTEEEARLANEAAMQVQLDEIQAFKDRQAEQARMRREMAEVNNQLRQIAAIEREENRLADLKVQEFMRRKAEQEKQREEELEQMRIAKEKELARLRAMQEKAADVQAEKDEINAQRIQDEVERQWRRKEREAAITRAKENEDLKRARQRQVDDRRTCQAIEIQREKEEAEKIARVNMEAVRRDQEEMARRLCSTDEHRMQLLKQINEKEREKISNRQMQFQEGVAIKMDEKKRNEVLRDTMVKKMTQIRGHNVPEKYVKEVERQLKLLD